MGLVSSSEQGLERKETLALRQPLATGEEGPEENGRTQQTQVHLKMSTLYTRLFEACRCGGSEKH